MKCSTCNGSGRVTNEERGRARLNIPPVNLAAHEYGGRAQGKSIAQSAMAGLTLAGGGTVLTHDAEGQPVVVQIINGAPVFTSYKPPPMVAILDEMSAWAEPTMTRARALQFIRDLARDMQAATTSHVRRQGRRLARALQAVEGER